MSNNTNYYQHLLHIYQTLYSLRQLPYEARVKQVNELIDYFKSNLSSKVKEENKQVLEAQQTLYQHLSEAMHFESSYELLCAAFSKARDQLRHDPDRFDGFGDLLEQIPCKSSTESIIYLLAKDEVSIEQIVRLHLAEHDAILHPERPNHFASLINELPL